MDLRQQLFLFSVSQISNGNTISNDPIEVRLHVRKYTVENVKPGAEYKVVINSTNHLGPCKNPTVLIVNTKSKTKIQIKCL